MKLGKALAVLEKNCAPKKITCARSGANGFRVEVVVASVLDVLWQLDQKLPLVLTNNMLEESDDESRLSVSVDKESGGDPEILLIFSSSSA